MSYFFWLSIALLVATLIFYIVFATLIYYWHEKKTSIVIIPLIFTFDFLIIAFLVVCLASLALQFGPEILRLASRG